MRQGHEPTQNKQAISERWKCIVDFTTGTFLDDKIKLNSYDTSIEIDNQIQVQRVLGTLAWSKHLPRVEPSVSHHL